jgi:RNA polymerase sigma-70 factor, ECF subfamily
VIKILNETELIEKSKQGDKSALSLLLHNNYPILRGYIFKMTAEPYITEDIVQETMLKAVLNIGKFNPDAKFSTWLIKISINIYRDYLRKNKITEPIENLSDSTASSIEESVITKLDYREVMDILMSMSYEKRAVFILKHYYGYKYEEIASILNCPIGTVRSRLHNCVQYILNVFERRNKK